jgi:hypothetical protein
MGQFVLVDETRHWQKQNGQPQYDHITTKKTTKTSTSTNKQTNKHQNPHHTAGPQQQDRKRSKGRADI